MSIDHDSDTARLARHRDLFRIVHPDVATASCAAHRVSDSELWQAAASIRSIASGMPDGGDKTALNRSLDVVVDGIDWLERGNDEWRCDARRNAGYAESARATARIAIGHLQAMLNKARTFQEGQDAETAARDWLASIGSES